MIHRFAIGAVAVLSFLGAAVLCLGGTSARAAADEAKKAEGTGAYELVAPLDAIMYVMDDNLFQRIPERIKAADFKNLRREAFALAEVANVMAHAKEHREKKEWGEIAGQMKEAALKLADAADPKKKDAAAANTHRAAIEKSCDACHEKFRD